MDVSREAAELLFGDGLYEEAILFLEIIASNELREDGPNSARYFQTRTRIAEICVVQERYAQALKILLDIYSSKLKTTPLDDPSSMDTRSRIRNLVRLHGSPDVLSQAMQDFVDTSKCLIKITRKKYLKGLHIQALSEGIEILSDMMQILGNSHPITFEMGSLVAILHTTTEDFKTSLQFINNIYERKKRIVGPTDKRLANTVMKRATIFFKMCDYEEAIKCYCEAYSIRKVALGPQHKKTLSSLRRIAEVCYTVGNYEEALSILTEIAEIQKFHSYKELMLTKIHIGILELSRGNYEDALSIFRDISVNKKTPRLIRTMIQNKKGASLSKLGRYHEATIVIKNACNTIEKTNFYIEMMSTYRNFAVLLAKGKKFVTAETVFIFVIATAVVLINPIHSVVLSMENDLAEFWFYRGKQDEAMEVFRKLWKLQNEKKGQWHPATLRAKCQVAKFLNEQCKYDEALKMYNEVIPFMKAHYYPQHLEYLDIEHRIASIYLCRNSYLAAFEIYYKVYKIVTKNYDDDHPIVIETTEKMNSITDRVPLRRVIEASLIGNIEDLRTFVENGDDINAPDVNGAVALHYASREGHVNIIKYLLSNGAIYDTEDMIGNTPETFSKNNETRLIFLLVKRLFECVQRGEREQIRRILTRESSILNARDSASRTPLHWAVIKGHFEIVEDLLTLGADISLHTTDDGNVLHMAVERDHYYVLELLLWHLRNSNIDLFRRLIDSTDNVLGVTPLHIAAKKNRKECVETLMHYLANPMITDLFDKPSCHMGSLEMQQLMTEYVCEFLNLYEEYAEGTSTDV